jgi:hypothetical protein
VSAVTYTLRREQRIPRPIDEVFTFFADAHNLEIYTSAIIRPVLKLHSTFEFLKDLLGGDARIHN